LKPGTIIKPGEYVQQSELEECRRENRELKAALRKISETEQCKHELSAKMSKFKMGFAFNRREFDRCCGACECAKCVADKALNNLEGDAQ